MSGKVLQTLTVTTMEGLSRVRSEWESMQEHPNADFDFFKLIASCRDEVVSPFVVMAFAGTKPVAMAAGRLEDTRLPCKFGYRTLFSIPVRSITLVYGSVIGDELHGAELFEVFDRSLRDGVADVLILPPIHAQSVFLAETQRRPHWLRRSALEPTNKHRLLRLPESLEAFFGRFSKKQRYNLKRPSKRLRKDFSGEIDIRCYRELVEVAEFCRAAESVAKTAYQRALGSGFVDDTEHRRRLTLAAQRGWLRAYVLWVQGQPVAYWLCTLYRRVLHSEATGYIPSMQRYEPGKVLFLGILEEQCEAQECEAIDFGLGDSEYKKRYGDMEFEESSARVFSPRLPGLLAGICWMGPRAMDRLARRAVFRLGLEQRIKTLWRRSRSHYQPG